MHTPAVDNPHRRDLSATLASGKSLRLVWFSMGSLPIFEIGVHCSFDAAVIDLQHGLWDRNSTHNAIAAAGSLPTLVRAAHNDERSIGEALDSGAAGVLVPVVETAEEAARAVSYANFPPVGRRSLGGVRPLSQGLADLARHVAESRAVVGIMIETVTGVVNAAAIAATPGIDFVFIGTGDLALSIGCFPEFDERHEAACRALQQACQKARVPCGIFTTSAAAAIERLSEGYRIVVAANDVDTVVAGFGQARSTMERPGA
jgi:2-keto-3-deoxy-L-rhamnonate aldolase RhmA